MIRRAGRWALAWVDRHWLEFFSLASVGLLLLIVLWPLIIYNVPSGHVGVMWYRFFGGTVTGENSSLPEGFHIILPWDKIFLYDARLQKISEDVSGLSVDGLTIKLTLSSRFVIDSKHVGFLHKSIGPSYIESLMRPELRTKVLTYISENEAEDLYSTRRAQVQNVIATQFQQELTEISSNTSFNEAYIKLEDVLIEEIILPPFVTRAIEEKEKVRHMNDAYEFRLLLEEKERRRKQIEAEGIRTFQEIVAPGITDSYLRWRGIEATLELSKSDNAKVVIIGNSSDGLPIILNTDSFQAGALPTAPDTANDAPSASPSSETGSAPENGASLEARPVSSGLSRLFSGLSENGSSNSLAGPNLPNSD